MSVPNAKANEPSMEDILASIRRIIADDQAGRPEDGVEPPPPPVAPASAASSAPLPPAMPALKNGDAAPPRVPPAVLELTPDDEEPALPEPTRARVEPPKPKPAPVPMTPEFKPDPEPPLPAERPARPRDDARLIDPQIDAMVADAFGSLASTVVPHNARTVEDLVQDLLRPLLKAWLDENLPTLVERLVRAEIERVARGRST